VTHSFAKVTGQECCVLYSEDFVGRGRKRTILTGKNAQAAWNTPIKSHANDFSGRLALVIGMPVYIVDNMAVELGVSKGSRGILTGVKYRTCEGRHYAISAEVDLPLYTSFDPNAEFPHRLTIPV
ncbi:hypothetical protein C8J56DRAFT_739998, partial [Mycena floridula]